MGRSGDSVEMALAPIGVVRSPYRDFSQAPHQGRFSSAVSEIEVFEEFSPALKDIDTCTHLIVLYWLDRAKRDVLATKTPYGDEVRGVFATRSPHRPNPIGFCVVELLEVKGNVLRVRWLDALDGSLVVDIKPYSSDIDCVENAVIGWFMEVSE
ncbi:tRNA (N6-threonylcarbamoyladenosine(37)-N6)-methyltransferase TrmO [Geoglobus sp.]